MHAFGDNLMGGPNPTDFPKLRASERHQWAPILMRPLIDSPEQLVIGVVAIGENSYHLECANQIKRLECLFSDRSIEIIRSARLGLKSMERQLAERKVGAIRDFRAPASSIHLGEIREDVGASAQEVARFWISAISTLHQGEQHREIVTLDAGTALEPMGRGVLVEPRPTALVVEAVIGVAPDLSKNFREHFLQGRRPTGIENVIDYSSDIIVANIDFIPPNFRAPSVNRVVKRMWDLEIDRSRNPELPPDRHEMLVKIPDRDEFELSREKVEKIHDTVQKLTWQADQRDIRFRHFTSPEEIGGRILEAEGLAA